MPEKEENPQLSQPKTTHEQYIQWLRQSSLRRRPLLEKRLAHAWQIARQAAKLLKERYRVSRVRLFGSLLYPERFHEGSDIDLAVEGLVIGDYWDALADVLFLDPELTIDLTDPDTCPPNIWTSIEREGVEL